MKINKKLMLPTLGAIAIGLLLTYFGFSLTGGVLFVYAVVLNLV